MNRKTILPIFFLIVGSVLHFSIVKAAHEILLTGGTTLVLYDANAASGAIPDAPLMNFIAFPPGAATPAYSDGITILDTMTSGMDAYAGWISNGANIPGFPILDRTAGFQVNFTIQVENESHTKDDRAGFSIIVLSEDARGIELAFWENEIWAQSDSTTGELFRHGEGVMFATTNGLVEYQLSIAGDRYTLTSNSEPILTGPLRDYREFDGVPDPYETPNFLFLGDDTTSAQSRVRLGFVSVTGAEPVMPTATLPSTSTSSTFPMATLTPLPSATSVPFPTPVGTAFELCPSGWIFLIGLLTVLGKKIRLG